SCAASIAADFASLVSAIVAYSSMLTAVLSSVSGSAQWALIRQRHCLSKSGGRYWMVGARSEYSTTAQFCEYLIVCSQGPGSSPENVPGSPPIWVIVRLCLVLRLVASVLSSCVLPASTATVTAWTLAPTPAEKDVDFSSIFASLSIVLTSWMTMAPPSMNRLGMNWP